MRVALNVYVGLLLLVFFAAGMAIANRLEQLRHTSHQVVQETKADRR